MKITLTSEFEWVTYDNNIIYLVSVHPIYGWRCYIACVYPEKEHWFVYKNLHEESEAYTGMCSSLLDGKRKVMQYLKSKYFIT